jgi:hypothetical protein
MDGITAGHGERAVRHPRSVAYHKESIAIIHVPAGPPDRLVGVRPSDSDTYPRRTVPAGQLGREEKERGGDGKLGKTNLSKQPINDAFPVPSSMMT